MTDYIVRQAIQNIWCSPEQDYQHIIQPARISRPRGVRQSVRVEWESIQLPTSTDTYHVYQIGQLSPKYLNLASEQRTWIRASEACSDQNLMVDFYFNNGRQLPRFDIYFRRTQTRNLLVAVREQRLIGNLIEEPIYVRFYSNAYFASERAQEDSDGIHIEGRYPSDRRDVILFQRRIRDLREEGGHVYVFHNGYLVEDTHPDLVNPGDVLEVVQDTSIKEVLDFPVRNLETFHSDLDGMKKYLFSRLKKTTTTIDYQDDIDLWLWKNNGDRLDRLEGVYVHKNQPYTHRMLTHKDTAIPVKTVVGFAEERDDWKDPLALTLRMHIRRSGYKRDLVWEHNRIQELYRLDDDEIVRAMLGANSTVDVWKASALEKSAYVELMGIQGEDITRDLVERAYGYNAVSKLIADNPIRVGQHDLDGGVEGVHLPPGLRHRSTLYEYDGQGRLLTSHFHEEGEFHQPSEKETELVEGIMGQGGESLDTVFGLEDVELDPNLDYGVYICDVIAGIPDYEWRFAEEGEHYEISNGVLQWFVSGEEHYGAVRSDAYFLSYRLPLWPNNGILRFSVAAREVENGEASTQPLKLPVGRLDLYLNQHPLIEGLDYTVHWPEVVVHNKTYLTDNEVQDLFVRGVGFVDREMKRQQPEEVGFVTHGLISRNDRFDVRNDKVMRFVIGGGVRHRDELKFSEDHHGYRMEDIPNGTPYAVEDVVVPMRNFTDRSTEELRERSLAVDRQVSDYLSKYWPEKPIAYPSKIEQRYPILSPFTARIHYDLYNGLLNPEGIEGQYGDGVIKKTLEDYEWLLDYDPVLNGYDKDYVSIHPHGYDHVTELDIYRYTFLKRAIGLYLNGEVDLTSFVKVKEGWVEQ